MKRLMFRNITLVFFSFIVTLRSTVATDVGADTDVVEHKWKDVAVNRETKQTSLFNESSLSEFAVDGDDTTCSRTAHEKFAEWTIFFGQPRVIAQLRINTGSAFFGSNFEIYIGGNDSAVRSLCSFGSTNSTVMAVYVLPCYGGPKLGHSLTISNRYSSGVQLCDVKLMECDDGYFGSDCTLQCHCGNDSICDKSSGQCPDQCAAGFNGTNCQDECDAGTFSVGCVMNCHCAYDLPCNVSTGMCPAGCAPGWLGQTCQTVFPRISAAPSFVSARETYIVIRWNQWPGEIEAPFTLFYLVEYKQVTMSQNDTVWTHGKLVEHKPMAREVEATVLGLRRNTFYDFRVTPLLRTVDNGWMNGTASQKSSSFRTKCSVPAMPVIKNVEAFIMTSHRHESIPAVGVGWTLLTDEESNCERIRNYEILYQKHGSTTWDRVSVSNAVAARNITENIEFAVEYWVMLTAYNNQPLESSSERMRVVTPFAPSTLPPINVVEGTRDAGIIAGAVICAAVFIALILGALLYRWKVAGKSKQPLGESTVVYSPIKEPAYEVMTSSMLDLPEPKIVPRYPENGRINKNMETRPSPAPRFPVAVSSLEDYIMSRQNNECEDLRKEYMEIPDHNADASTSIGEHADNRLKNRFINIIPYNHSRVVLDTANPIESDYINASYIDGYNRPKAYIASQGCNKWTVQDIWRMVWQVNCYRIVMVTNLVEKGKVKCEMYWPDVDGEEKTYSNISVTLTDVERTADFVIRSFKVVLDGKTRQIKHFHFTAWPDHGVPNRTAPIIEFRRKIRSHDDSHPGPIVIHCSAGVGRTGAFIAIDSMLDQAKLENQVDVYNFTWKMRKDRANMIQTVEQYIFVYNALLEALKAGNTVIACCDFRTEYERLCHIDPTKGKSGLLEQFETLQTMLPGDKPDDYVNGNSAENQLKNRFSHIVPAERHRPYLMTRVQGTNDYINAVFLDGYRNRSAYVITQMPLPHTVIDLWRLVFEHNCGTIVMLNPWDDTDETYGQYWPEENEECECGPFVIEAVSVDRKNPEITVRELKLTHNETSPTATLKKKDDGPRIVNQFQFNLWPKSSSVPTSKLALMTLLDHVEKSQRKTGNAPVIVHCHDGVQHSGLYAVISCIWERLKDEQNVDVFQAVRHLRYHRPQIIHDVEQYEFCYEMVLTYLAEFDTYANFR